MLPQTSASLGDNISLATISLYGDSACHFRARSDVGCKVSHQTFTQEAPGMFSSFQNHLTREPTWPRPCLSDLVHEGIVNSQLSEKHYPAYSKYLSPREQPWLLLPFTFSSYITSSFPRTLITISMLMTTKFIPSTHFSPLSSKLEFPTA